jgi:hypothetical protein
MRVLRFFFNTLVYGTGYAVLNDLIHRPQPLNEEKFMGRLCSRNTIFTHYSAVVAVLG